VYFFPSVNYLAECGD